MRSIASPGGSLGPRHHVILGRSVLSRRGQDPGLKFYTHVSDQFGPFHTKVIAATANEAPHVLDGLLYHQSSLVITSTTPTPGASRIMFCHVPSAGFRFAPRIRDLKEKRLYLLPGMIVPPEFASLVAGAINVRVIRSRSSANPVSIASIAGLSATVGASPTYPSVRRCDPPCPDP